MLPAIRKVVIGFAIMGIAVMSAACGSGTAASADQQPAASSSAAVAAAQARIAEMAKPVTINYKPGPLPDGYRGKTIAVVSNQTATGRHSNELFTAAAGKLGITVKPFAVGSSAEEVANTFDQIVADASIQGMIVGGVDPTAWNRQLQALQARNVPVVMYAVVNNPAWNTMTIVSIEAVHTGVGQAAEAAADWIIANSNGTADSVVFNVPSRPILTAVYDAFSKYYGKQCPGCKLDKSDVDAAGIGKTIPGAVVSYLQAHPKTKYAYFEFGDMITGVPQALKAAGITDIRLVSQAASGTNLTYIKAGDEAANFSYPLPLIAYVGVDALARGMTSGDMSVAAKWIMPVQLMTKENVGSGTFGTDGSTTPPGLDKYFEELWSEK